ncbi:MAG: FMN-binding negative transcriptional regulator [Armatimonadota bacterium]
MYVPKPFAEPDVAVLHQLMCDHPLATLVTVGADGPEADLIPLSLVVTEDAPLGVLQGHVARANPLWREHGETKQVLAVFHGPESYISPSWYATKQETGRVVPTWNYAVVQAHGTMRVIDDSAWLLGQIEALTRSQEVPFENPWSVADAPAEYVEKLLTAIVGIEITISRLQGKWKVSQNQPEANRSGVIEGLESRGTEKARNMAALVRERSECL